MSPAQRRSSDLPTLRSVVPSPSLIPNSFLLVIQWWGALILFFLFLSVCARLVEAGVSTAVSCGNAMTGARAGFGFGVSEYFWAFGFLLRDWESDGVERETGTVAFTDAGLAGFRRAELVGQSGVMVSGLRSGASHGGTAEPKTTPFKGIDKT